MPKVTVRRPHSSDPQTILAQMGVALENTAREFDATDVTMTTAGNRSDFSFKTLGFKVGGQVEATASEVVVEVDLPLAAAPFQSVAEQVIGRHVDAAIRT
jgi:hypothetical protein